MRADLSPAVAAAIDRCERPTLVFDRARLERNLTTFAEAARAHGITTLFAAKSFPHRAVWAMAASALDGFDVASEGELATVPASKVVSIVDPSGRAGARAREEGRRVIVGCETVEQVVAAPAHAEIAIRVSASITGRDPAVGAVQDGSGHRRSRFGLEGDASATLVAMRDAAAGRRVGLHVHHGPVTATSGQRFAVTARAVLELAGEAEVEPAFLDLGGAWHGVADVPRALGEVRAAVPKAIEVIVEPGRLFADEAGFACGRVVVERELADRRLRVVDVSRLCHLRWSQIELVGTAPHAGTGVGVLLVGPTCSEEDVLGEWTVRPDMLGRGDRVVFRHVSGYAVAWNVGFGGVAPADVVIAG
jgi:diaminopimelate decarboxylase